MDIEKDKNFQMKEEQGQALVCLARQTIAQELGHTFTQAEIDALEQALDDDMLKTRRGNFVTLKISENLRGCIGSLESYVPLVQGVRDNALNAAFKDPRFGPLTEEEFLSVTIEVSVLTDSEPLAYENGDDLLVRLRPNVDGVTIRKGIAAATFLPQVWEQLPKPQNFLRNLCLKAGLPADEWRNGRLDVFTYQVQYFEENS